MVNLLTENLYSARDKNSFLLVLLMLSSMRVCIREMKKKKQQQVFDFLATYEIILIIFSLLAL